MLLIAKVWFSYAGILCMGDMTCWSRLLLGQTIDHCRSETRCLKGCAPCARSLQRGMPENAFLLNSAGLVCLQQEQSAPIIETVWRFIEKRRPKGSISLACLPDLSCCTPKHQQYYSIETQEARLHGAVQQDSGDHDPRARPHVFSSRHTGGDPVARLRQGSVHRLALQQGPCN